MRVIREIEVGGRKVQVRELTVGEIREWISSLADLPPDVTDQALFEELALSELARMTDLPVADMSGLTPSELDQVLALAKEVNGRFFAMRSRLANVGTALQAMGAAS